MSLRHAILGLLHYADMSGYDLSQYFDRSIRHYWSTEHTQIYRALAALADERDVTYSVVEQSGKPDKKLYHLTLQGRAAFQDWLGSRLPLPEIRHTHLLQFSFMASQPTREVLEFIESYAVQIEERLSLYRDTGHQEATWRHARDAKELAIWQLVLENGIRYYETELAWCRRVADVLGGMGDDGAQTR
ncbi:MAG: PadR family transcriptional regulator [Thermoleophilia bacterium]|nr:PadR family transcriptional regulator [Thermoleophilia bacterium]